MPPFRLLVSQFFSSPLFISYFVAASTPTKLLLAVGLDQSS